METQRVARDDFSSFAVDTLRYLSSDEKFLDVSLVTEDERLFKAHRIILSASSPFFRNILGQAVKHQDPFLFLKGVKSHILEKILQFIYLGEINVFDPFIDKVPDGVHLVGGVECKDIDSIPLGKKEEEEKKVRPRSSLTVRCAAAYRLDWCAVPMLLAYACALL